MPTLRTGQEVKDNYFLNYTNKSYFKNINIKLNAYLKVEGYVFNFFDEIKNKAVGVDNNLLNDFNIINLSGKLLYVEGHQGVTVINQDMIVFKVKRGRVVIEGEGLFLCELTDNTLTLQGKINKMEIF